MRAETHNVTQQVLLYQVISRRNLDGRSLSQKIELIYWHSENAARQKRH